MDMGNEGHDEDLIESLVSAVDLRRASPRKEVNRKMILDAVESSVGIQQLNELVRQALEDKLTEIAAQCG